MSKSRAFHTLQQVVESSCIVTDLTILRKRVCPLRNATNDGYYDPVFAVAEVEVKR